jgi:hypothetical protein
MRSARRRFVIGSALGCMFAGAAPTRAASAPSPAPAAATLRAYVDTLLPADETPSGTALGVDERLLAVAKQRQDYRRMLDWGLDWLNAQARARYLRDFPQLDEAQRDAVLRIAATGGYGTPARVFFERTRADAFTHYYARPESWRGIVQYRGPPQPLGFADYAQPPRASR